MSVESFLAIGIVGTFLSVVIELLKKKFPTKPLVTKLSVIALSVVVGLVYVWLQDTNLLPTILTILGAASTVYAMFFRG